MPGWVARSLRTVIALALFGSLVVQVAIGVGVWVDDTLPLWKRISLSLILIPGIGCLQVIGVSTWRLVNRVAHGTVFSRDSFAYVNRVIVALATGATLLFALAVFARFANQGVEGDEIAPGLVALICGFSLVTGGVALVVYVLKLLLAQAVALDAEAKYLQSELDEVI